MSYKSGMCKIVERWLLFEYVGRELTLLSRPFETKKQAEKAREKYRERYTTPSCERLRGVAMLWHEATLNESTCKVAKAVFRTGA